MRKIAMISIMFIFFISLSFVCAEDSLENASLTTNDADISLSQEEIVNDFLSLDESDEVLEVNEELSVDDSNYDKYFSSITGKLKSNLDASKINTLKIGNVSEKLFTVNTPLNIMPVSSDCQMRNSVIHLVAGSDGSNITGLTINNTNAEIRSNGMLVCKLHGIWFTNSSYNYIYNNTIRIAEAEGCYAMPMGWSSYNRIFNNDMLTGFTCCMVMGSCHNNNISYNRLEIAYQAGMVVADCIYFNPFGHADYIGAANCTGNYIFGNYIKSNSNNDFSYTMALEGDASDTQVINNTVIGGYFGIMVVDIMGSLPEGVLPHNITIKGNTIINSSCSIATESVSAIISNNKVTGFSKNTGISVSDLNATVCDNVIEYDNLICGISVETDDAKVYNNQIKLSNYGAGIGLRGSNISVYKNTINVIGDEGIQIFGNSNRVFNNFISTKSDGILLSIDKEDLKIYNNAIFLNKIYSDKYAVVINGYVYNTQIYDNIIETNSSEAFYINIKETVKDRNPGKLLDNNVNGIFEDTDTIIVNDSNFYDYFDEDGYLTYEFNITQKRMLFLTFLSNKNLHFTDQIALTSNKQPNLLYNVSIVFSEDACDSSIKDFKFYNFDQSTIILDGVENVDIKDNEFTTITSDIFDFSVISVIGGCVNSNIVNNDISIISDANYTYAISITDSPSKIRKSFSSGFTISNNNIFVKSTGVGEGIYADGLVNSTISSNDISLICDDSAYGIAIANVFGRPHDIKIDSNEIIINSKEMSYLIELFMSDFIEITNNYLKGVSNGVYGVGVYNSRDININGNEIVVVGRNLTEKRVFDALGKGNTALYIYKSSKVNSLSENIIDIYNSEILTKDAWSFINKFGKNYFVISPYNYDSYFDFENRLNNSNIKKNDVILFKNFTTFKTMKIDFPILIEPYKHLNQFTSNLILSGNYSDLNVSGFDFKDAKLELNNISNVNIALNSFVSSEIHDLCGVNNSFLNNSFVFDAGKIVFDGSLNSIFAYNNVIVNSSEINVVLIKNTNGTVIFNNLFNATGGLFNLITSDSSINNNISYNLIVINSTGDIHAYNSLNTTLDNILNNKINVYGDNTKSVVYYDDSSSNNNVKYNRIVSSSVVGDDYAVAADSIGNIISNNYLISSNGYRRGNDAVNASLSIVRDNTPFDLYVSANVNITGNGSIESPYSTIGEALENALSGTIIYILPGCYNESNWVIDKNITLTAINQEGNTYINALNTRLFEITKTGELTVNALKIFNGFSQNGGGLFYNKGTLVINNSMIYNSSSYYNNSNPTFKADKYTKYTWNSYDCENLGLGGAILNYGNLLIYSSNLFDNYAHKGGALADFGKTTIKNSVFYNNTGVHGGAVYTDSKKEFDIESSYFHDNLAITTLDHCYIKKVNVNAGYEYRNAEYYYSTQCDIECGDGGAIFSNSPLVIKNSLFEENVAKSGGAIATNTNIQNYYDNHDVHYSDYGKNHKYADTTLSIQDTIFRGNIAQNTMCGNQTLLTVPKYTSYNYIYFQGGAIFGSMIELNIKDSLFENNIANTNGGALSVQCGNSTIEGCRFYNNTAGAYGGALDIYGNSKVFNTEIVNNHARGGGALQYYSHTSYGHKQNNMDMFNVTITDNVALDKGGAFLLVGTQFKITNSNIYGNRAPNGDTFGGKYGAADGSVIDARNNWWGSVDGPDDSVWSQLNVRFRTWASDKIKWGPVSISPSTDDNQNGKSNNGNSYTLPADSKTGTSIRTGSTLTPGSESYGGNSREYNFPENWPSSGVGNGPGSYGGFNGNGLKFGGNPSSNGKAPVKGDAVNPNSMSKINSSTVNDLASVGMAPNAADSSMGSPSSSAGDGGSEGSAKAYEIKKDVKKEIMDDDISVFNILFILLWVFLFIGFYRKYKNID